MYATWVGNVWSFLAEHCWRHSESGTGRMLVVWLYRLWLYIYEPIWVVQGYRMLTASEGQKWWEKRREAASGNGVSNSWESPTPVPAVLVLWANPILFRSADCFQHQHTELILKAIHTAECRTRPVNHSTILQYTLMRQCPVPSAADTRTFGTLTCQQVPPSFQSPEQLTVMDGGAEADIYSFGGVAVEVLEVSVFPWKCWV